MNTSTQLPSSHPLIVAWERYKRTDEFYWAMEQAKQEQLTVNALWAAYLEGWIARREFEERQPLARRWWQFWK